MDVGAIAADIVDQAFQLHRGLGPGLLESVYEAILAGKLAKLGYDVRRQQAIDIQYDDLRFEAAFRIDLLVNGHLLVEVKSVERLSVVHAKHLLTYLRLTNQSLGCSSILAARHSRKGCNVSSMGTQTLDLRAFA
jgi:GxxExxY protein